MSIEFEADSAATSSASQRPGCLAGVRVLDLCGDLGRFATKLLTELGASTVKPMGWGARGTPMADPAVAARGGLADWYYDAAKLAIAVDAETAPGQRDLQTLAAQADVLVEDRPPGWMTAHDMDARRLLAANPALVHVSLTPFGLYGPRADWQSSDLVAGALGGVCSITGTSDKPLTSWGRQNYHFGGYFAAISALAGLHRARASGRGEHIDVSLHEVVTGSIENLFFQYFYADLLPALPALAPRQGALHWLGAYDLAPAAQGAVMITPTPTPSLLLQWMVEDGCKEAEEFLELEIAALLPRLMEVMDLVRRWVKGHDAAWLFEEAQRRHVAFGEVQAIPKVATNPQFAHRGFLQPAVWDGPSVVLPVHPVRFSGTPSPPLKPPPSEALPLPQLLEHWSSLSRHGAIVQAGAAEPTGATKGPLAGLRVADFTWVLAGPFCTRILGDLGADVIKVQNEAQSTLVNQPDYPYYAVWNRSKRSALLDMKHPDALAAARRLIEQSDVLVENYSAGVLDRWGLGWETVHAWNPRLIYVSMSGCGHTGPWKNVISYAPTVHALCGLTYLTNPAGRHDVGLGFSLNDHAAGLAAATAVLAAIEARHQSGEGQLLDMAQLEVGSYLIGPAIVDYLANGIAAEPNGNQDCVVDHVPNDTYLCADGEWLALTANDDGQWTRLCGVLQSTELQADPQLAHDAGRRTRRELIDVAVADWCRHHAAAAAMETLQAAGVAAGVVQNAAALFRDPQHQARGFWQSFENHPMFGTRPFDRYPARWSESSLEPYLRSPYFGEHTFEVFAELCAMTVEEVATGIGDGLFA